MADPVRLFILAGEPSGDRIGADLVRRLRISRPVTLLGVGGEGLTGEGLKSLFPMSDLSVMGVQDVLRRAPLLLWRIRQTVRAILAAEPDLVVLIDSQVFSQMVAQQLRRRGYAGRILLYVAPSVWAWKPERAPLLKPLFDEVLAVLPFEPAVMKRLDGPPTTYVGHPALEHTVLRDAQPARGPLLLLPGSRRGELRRHLPLMEEMTLALKRHPQISDFVLPTTRHEEEFVLDAVRAWDVPVFVTSASARKWQAFREAIAAVAVTGTVTLELALSGVPMVTTYVADRAQWSRASKARLRFASLPNILVGDELVPELLGPERRSAEVLAALEALLGDEAALTRQLEGFARIRAGMEKGAPEAPRTDPAERVLAHLPAIGALRDHSRSAVDAAPTPNPSPQGGGEPD
ncbi:MAG TPA: lipid-A-disaccharide synthase [Devosia sp.]|jgi:lipid-A-disaccharide synthase|nr:lipid-A-disaccharide synthase [Devosia sp.]